MKSLFAAYAAVWVLLFAYVASLASRQRKLARDLEELKRRLKAKD